MKLSEDVPKSSAFINGVFVMRKRTTVTEIKCLKSFHIDAYTEKDPHHFQYTMKTVFKIYNDIGACISIMHQKVK